MKQHALALASMGFRVFPIAVGAKSPPLLNGWPQKATSDAAEIESFWLAVPNANVGLHCEGLLVIDVDPRKGGDDSLELLRITDDLPATLCTRTPSGGRHFFYRLPDGHPGVPNSVGDIGPGLDVRSTGGYVVAPGSVVSAGAYAFESDTREIARAPEWFIRRAGNVRVRSAERDTDSRVHDADLTVVERAREWLAQQTPAIQGQGGDARTFAVACGLRDFGVSRTQALKLLTQWNVDCQPPWEPQDLATKVSNAYRYAENEAGSRAASPDDFPALIANDAISGPNLGTIVPKSGTLGALSLEQFAGQGGTDAGYVVKGLLLRGSYAVAYGAPGEGKTFIALDLAYHVAAALPWMGKKVHAGTVLYLAYEGTGGMKKRAKALRQKYGTKDVPFYIASATFNLREQPGRRALGELMSAMPAKPVLIVIDTFARALMGGDENSAQDVGAFNTAIAALIENTGACVLTIHHSGKDKSRGARGSSALLGAIDTEIEIDSGQVIASKQRDIEISEPLGFKLVPLLVGVDADGDDMTSCVVEPSAVLVDLSQGRIGGNVKRAFEVLCQLRPDNRPIDVLEWRASCREFLGDKSLAQRFFDAKKSLVAKNYIVVDASGLVTRRMT